MVVRRALGCIATYVLVSAGLAGAGIYRYVVITDMTHDDGNSLIRLLHYANQIDIEAIIVTPQLPDNNYASLNPWNKAQSILTAYGSVRSLLARHDPAYPTVEQLRAVTKKGRGALPIIWTSTANYRFSDWIGEGMTPNGEPKDSEGSEFLQTVFAKNDPRPIFVGLWGGPITFTQALYRFRQRNPDKMQTLLDKLFIYSIHYQDITHDFFFNMAKWKATMCGNNGGTWSYYDGVRVVPRCVQVDGGHFWAWVSTSNADPAMVRGHGALSDLYDSGGEGDSPAFFHLLSGLVGLNDPREPTQGSWGNRFVPLPAADFPRSYAMCSVPSSELTRWIEDVNNSFRARLQYATRSPGQVNRPPVPAVNGDVSNRVIYISARAGQTVTLDGAGTTDPDNNQLSWRWWHYKEAGTYGGSITISGSNSPRATITLPADMDRGTVHIIGEVRDNGIPPLVAYRRVVIGDGVRDPWPESSTLAHLRASEKVTLAPPPHLPRRVLTLHGRHIDRQNTGTNPGVYLVKQSFGGTWKVVGVY